MPFGVAATYHLLRVLDAGLLTAGLCAVIVWWPNQTVASIFVMTVWLFGLVEYINYFHVRLSYPLRRWFTTLGQWRTPQLVKDMRSAVPTSGVS